MAEKLFELGPWKIWCDPELNRSIYSQIHQAGPEACRCGDCLRFAETRDSFYPGRVKELLNALGIDFRKETEVVTYGAEGSPPSLLQGWYNFAGRVESGAEALYYLPGDFQLDVSNGGLLPPPEFGSLSLVKIEWQWPTKDLRTS